MKTYLITGGAGFFGSILKQDLLRDGHFCISVDRETDDYRHENYISVTGDICDKNLLRKIFSEYKFEAIFHCAALLAHEVKDKDELWKANVGGTQNISDFAVEFGCKKIIFISSNCLWGKSFDYKVTEEEPPDPIEIYGKSKYECEKILLNNKNFDAIIFRSPTIMDEGRLGLLSLLFEFIDDNKNIPLVGDGNNNYQFIYAKDLSRAMKAALNYNKTDVFNIGSDNVKSFNAVYKYVIDKVGSKSRLVHFPKSPMVLLMKLCYFLKLSPLGPYQYKMIAANFIFDTTKIKRQLGFKPTLSNEEMLYKSYEYYKNNRADIESRKDVSAHRKNAKMGIIRLLKWLM